MCKRTPGKEQVMKTGIDEDEQIRRIMRLAEFRNSESVIEKVDILNKSEIQVPISTACKLLSISTKTYYKEKSKKTPEQESIQFATPHQLLSIEEEKEIIKAVLSAQLAAKCMSSHEVRELASELNKKRTLINKPFDRFWFRRFLIRNEDTIGKKKCPSVDDDRGELSIDLIEKYIEDVIDALKKIKDLRLLINMDEIGFGRRPHYGKRRNCVYVKNCIIPPVWRAETDNYHISWVCGISAAGTHIKPMLLTTRARMDPDFYDTFLPEFAEFYTTQKGYLTTNAMIEWIQSCLIPYVIDIREQIQNPNHPVVLILDGLSCHLNDQIMEEFVKIEPFILIPLPPHSSHITQPCDGTIFNVTKIRYQQTPSPNNKTIFTGKLCRIKCAIQQALSQENIISAWEKCGFHITITEGVCTEVEFTKEFQNFLKRSASGNDAKEYENNLLHEIENSF